MVVFPNAKINLGLRILSKREDGYHNLNTVFFPIQSCDALEIITQSRSDAPVEFSTSGREIPGDLETNLCLKAYHLLKKDFPQLPSIKVHLHKQIPMGAGLGGGSSDGAFMLKLLNEKFNLNINQDKLIEYALQLGSDCPFFIVNSPVLAESRGEIMKPILLNLNGKKITLVCPGIHISTKEAFSNVKPNKEVPSCEELVALPIERWRNTLINDFENSVFPSHPEIATIKEKLYELGAVYASMSGTGSTVYGIFEEYVDLKNIFPSHFEIIDTFVP
jgi:4-diphosphocytidyl-2-C-methyl-D-erythritol kinase